MLNSMTGYGRFEKLITGRNIIVEIKSVNHRYLEFYSRIPRAYGYLEEKLKSFMQSSIFRGKVEVSVSIQMVEGKSAQVAINREMAKSYVEALRSLREPLGLLDDLSLSTLCGFPDVFVVQKVTEDEQEIWEAVQAVAAQALEKFTAMRRVEGDRLEDDLKTRLIRIADLVEQVKEQSPQTVQAYRERLTMKINEVLADRQADEARIITEAAIFADRIAVDEETVRLDSHLKQFADILATQQAGPIGRKLDFLVQEINREINTIGSKAQDAKNAQVVVELKSEMEKIREQIQNIE